MTPLNFHEPVVTHARKDFPLLDTGMTVQAALDRIRTEGVGERVIYFYAVDDEEKLAGVLPTRRLLTAPLDKLVREIMIPRVVAVPARASVLEACEFFVLYKFLAFPVVDENQRVVGVVDVNLFTTEMLEAEESEAQSAVFETLGFRLGEMRGASAWKRFRLRLPWLLVTITAGTFCAMLAGLFEATLAGSLIIAFFLTLFLGLNESVSMQSMTLTIQALRAQRVSREWFMGAFRREVSTAILLGSACGLIVALVIIAWKQQPAAAFAIGSSILLSLIVACLFGLGVPSLLHRWKLDPKISAGPLTLALTDIVALALYFGIAALVLR